MCIRDRVSTQSTGVKMKQVLLCLALLCVVLVNCEGEAVASDVVVLSTDDFENTTSVLTGEKGPWFIKFYAPWCGHCKRMAGTWDEFATKTKGTYGVGKVDCTVNRGVCSRFGVRGYPTILFFQNGKYFDFDGKRELEAFESFPSNLEGEGKPVPDADATPSSEEQKQPIDLLKVTIAMLKKDFSELWAFKKAILGVVLGGGVVVGLLLGALLCSGSKSSKGGANRLKKDL
eukprot:TRINITY_DN2051_c0_g1_i2.p1 TRINITY_DN2051_c0_g1~~TRINITY_DN2051_c0_g1_i2.p1  ORF type:complete len:231 (-),score=53.83 TRINITY_DN2051_c0_g1_i2:104-796(-)